MIRKTILLIMVGILVLVLASVVLAAPQVFDLSWWTVDGGGGVSEGKTFTLQGTIGQAEAGYQMSGGEYTMAGGFWGSGALPQETNEIYLPLMLR